MEASNRGHGPSIVELTWRRVLCRGGQLSLCLAVVLAGSEARAGECTPSTPACHLANGKALLASDPKRATDELLASFKLDERTDTLELYATALQLDHRYAHALETWKRIIVFRDSELEAAKLTARTATGRKLAAARATVARAQRQSEQAAEAIIELWANVGRVRLRLAAGQQVAVSHDGAEVDVAREVLVDAGHDELVFTRPDGSVERVAVEVAAGGSTKIDVPAARIAVARPGASEPSPVSPREAAEPEPAPVQPLAEPSAHAPVHLADAPRSRTMQRVGLGLIAGGLVAGGVAGYVGYLANRDFDHARDEGCTGDGQCPFGPAADLADRSNDRARIAQITAIGGGALLVTGAVMWFVGRGKEHRAAPEIALRVGPSSSAVGWRF